MRLALSRPDAVSSAVRPSIEAMPPSLTLGAYLAAVAAAVTAGMPQRSWIEATVSAVKPSPYGHALQLVDPAGGSSAPTMRAFLRTADRQAIARRLGASLDPAHLVDMTARAADRAGLPRQMGHGRPDRRSRAGSRESLLRRALEEVRARLKAERLYDRQKRLPVPPDVVRVAVIHPAGAAGYADIAGELTRWQSVGIVEVRSIAAPFEGPRATAELIAALRRAASGDGVPPDVVLVVRGGGAGPSGLTMRPSPERLPVPVPIITGLGHQVDSPLVGDVACRHLSHAVKGADPTSPVSSPARPDGPGPTWRP